MDVSIIIVNWNTRDILRDCLGSIYTCTKDLAFEVIVIDNASSDGSTNMIRREFPQVRLIANSENKGFAAANNQGMRLAEGRYMLLLNSDTVVLDSAIPRMVAFADSQPQAAVLGCRVLNPDQTMQRTCFMYPSPLNMLLSACYLYKLFPRNRLCGREQMTWWGRDDVREVEVVTGCFMLVRREAIDQVGRMDEDFYMYGEETDWCFRFRQAGWKVLFAPYGQIIHLGGASSRQAANEMTLQSKAGILQFLHKHRSRWTYTAGCALMGTFLGLRIPFWLVRMLWPHSGRREAWLRVVVYAAGLSRILRGWRGLRREGRF